MSILPVGLVLCVAIALTLLGGALFLKTLRFRAKAQLVDAFLVKGEDIGEVREDGRMIVRLSYEYSAVDGRVMQAYRSSLRWHIPPIGSIHRMLVDPEKPKSLQPSSIREYLVPLIFVVIGIIILLMITVLP